MNVISKTACFFAILLWLIIGILVLCSKKEPTKKDYAICWIILIMQLVLNLAKE